MSNVTRLVTSADHQNQSVQELYESLGRRIATGEVRAFAVTALMASGKVEIGWTKTPISASLLGAINRLEYKYQQFQDAIHDGNPEAGRTD